MRFTDQTRRDLCDGVARDYAGDRPDQQDNPIIASAGSQLMVMGVMIKYLEDAVLDRLEMAGGYGNPDRSFLDQFVRESISEVADQVNKALITLLPSIGDMEDAQHLIDTCHQIEQTA